MLCSGCVVQRACVCEVERFRKMERWILVRLSTWDLNLNFREEGEGGGGR